MSAKELKVAGSHPFAVVAARAVLIHCGVYPVSTAQIEEVARLIDMNGHITESTSQISQLRKAMFGSVELFDRALLLTGTFGLVTNPAVAQQQKEV